MRAFDDFNSSNSSSFYSDDDSTSAHHDHRIPATNTLSTIFSIPGGSDSDNIDERINTLSSPNRLDPLTVLNTHPIQTRSNVPDMSTYIDNTHVQDKYAILNTNVVDKRKEMLSTRPETSPTPDTLIIPPILDTSIIVVRSPRDLPETATTLYTPETIDNSNTIDSLTRLDLYRQLKTTVSLDTHTSRDVQSLDGEDGIEMIRELNDELTIDRYFKCTAQVDDGDLRVILDDSGYVGDTETPPKRRKNQNISSKGLSLILT